MNRRNFLRGSAGICFSLPLLASLEASNINTKVPKRLCCTGIGFGFAPIFLFPKTEGLKYEKTLLLKELEDHRGDFTLFYGLDHGSNGTGGHRGVHTFLSGIHSRNSKYMPEGNISIDQKAAQIIGAKTRFQSLQFSPGGESGSRMSWTASGVGIPPERSLIKIFQNLFINLSSFQKEKLTHTHNINKSVLDLVLDDAKVLSSKINKHDNEKLDHYLTSVREVEKKIDMSSNWVHKNKPVTSYKLDSDIDGMDFINRVPVFYDLIALSFQTDSTRIISFELSDIGKNLGGFNISKGYHQLTHHGKEPSYLKELQIIETFHIQQYSRFLTKLKSIKEVDGSTLFDNTINLLGSGMGNASSHSNRNLPLIVSGGGFKHLGFKDCSLGPKKSEMAARLYINLLQKFGLEIDEFALAKGNLSGFGV